MLKRDLNPKKCKLLLKENEVPRNIFLHSRKVNAIAMLIAGKLRKNREKIDLYLVNMASLLHDISKFQEIQSKFMQRHTFGGYNELIVRGYPLIARIVLKHGLDEVKSRRYGLQTWEEKIVYYADKRVNNDKVVSLDSRMRYLKGKYGVKSRKAMEKIKGAFKPIKELEKEIFDKLDINPEDITEESIKKFLIEDDY